MVKKRLSPPQIQLISSILPLPEEMTTTGLSKRNLVVKKGVFRAGGRYKVEGCVWQGVCAGQLISFKCGPTSGQYHVQLIDGNLIFYLVKLDSGCFYL